MFCQLLYNSPKNFISLKKFDSEFTYIEVWFTDQNTNPLGTEQKKKEKKKKDKINITLVVN